MQSNLQFAQSLECFVFSATTLAVDKLVWAWAWGHVTLSPSLTGEIKEGHHYLFKLTFRENDAEKIVYTWEILTIRALRFRQIREALAQNILWKLYTIMLVFRHTRIVCKKETKVQKFQNDKRVSVDQMNTSDSLNRRQASD